MEAKVSIAVASDQDIAIYSLAERIGHLFRTEVRYGVVRCFLDSLLLCNRSDEETPAQIDYGGRTAPSWSWMAYSGGIDFISDARQSLMVPDARLQHKEGRLILTAARVSLNGGMADHAPPQTPQ